MRVVARGGGSVAIYKTLTAASSCHTGVGLWCSGAEEWKIYVQYGKLARLKGSQQEEEREAKGEAHCSCDVACSKDHQAIPSTD
jgi:hypothetical protein